MKPWSERVQKALDLASQADPTAVPLLVDLLFENPIPLSQPVLSDEEVSKLLKYPGRAPQWEVEKVKIAVAYQKWIRKCLHLVSQIQIALQRFPNCALRDKLLDLTIQAAGFELLIEEASSTHSHISDEVHHLDIFASGEKTDTVVKELFKAVSPVTTNILHKLADKKDIIVKTGSCLSFEEKTISFVKERELAKEELARQGNPPYDPKAYYLQ